MTKRSFWVLLIRYLVFTLLLTTFQRGILVADCADIAIIFARGSNQPAIQPDDPKFVPTTQGVEEAYTFFQEIKSRVAEWIPVEKINLANFPNKYNGHGYEAKTSFGTTYDGTPPNALQEAFGLANNPYRLSVQNGVEELTGFLRDRVQECPKQQIVLGGYSQGAEVVGEALNKLPNNVLTHITYAALFGDPKLDLFNGAGDWLIGNKTPWVRGDVGWGELGGSLGAREPYIPDLMYGKTGSWCDAYDLICTGNILNAAETQLGGSHERYDDKWIPQAANEIVEHLNLAFPQYVGAIKTQGFIPQQGEGKVTDLMLVIDTTGSMGSVIGQVKQEAIKLVDEVFKVPETRVGIVEFRDHGSTFVARTDIGLTSDQQGIKAAIQNLTTGDGGDDPEAWYSGIMEAYNAEWRTGATKKLMLFADTFPKDPEPNTGYTKDLITQRGLEIDPVQIYIPYYPGFVATRFQPDFLANAGALSAETGGRVIKTPRWLDGNLIGFYQYAFSQMLQSDPVAIISAPKAATTEQSVTFAGNASFDPDSTIVEYAWDFDNDHSIDYQSDSPRATWTYNQPYQGLAVLYVKSRDGGVSSATTDIEVSKPRQTVNTVKSVESFHSSQEATTLSFNEANKIQVTSSDTTIPTVLSTQSSQLPTGKFAMNFGEQIGRTQLGTNGSAQTIAVFVVSASFALAIGLMTALYIRGRRARSE